MKTLNLYICIMLLASLFFVGCSSDGNNNSFELVTENDVLLRFDNTFGDTTIVLGDQGAEEATHNTSKRGQEHYFSQLKYIVSSIRLVNNEGEEVPYEVEDLDKGAMVIDQSKPESLEMILKDIPIGDYQQIIFSLGVPSDLNTLDEERFPEFYAATDAYDTEDKMHWYWGKGYRFTKIEGFFKFDEEAEDWEELSIHTGSTDGMDNTEFNTNQIDAERVITLDLGTPATVGDNAPTITVKADFDHLLSGTAEIKLTADEGQGSYPGANIDGLFYSKPVIHTADQMLVLINNLGGDNENDTTGIFSIESIEN